MVVPSEYKHELPQVKLSWIARAHFREKALVYTTLIVIFVALLVALFFLSFIAAVVLTFIVYIFFAIESVEVSEAVVFTVGFAGGTFLVYFLCLFCVFGVITRYLIKHGFSSFSLGPSPITKKIQKRLLKRNPKDPYRHEKFLRCMLISDTHGNHRDVPLPVNALKSNEIDVLICSGNFTYNGTNEEVEDFCLWLKSLAQFFSHIIVMPGSRDYPADKENYKKNWHKWHEVQGKHDPKVMVDLIKHALDDSPHDCMIHYLVDDYVVIDGVKFYGTPWHPIIMGRQGAFSRPESELDEHWNDIPADTNVLITHGPPHGILDKMMFSKFRGVGHVGLRRAVVRHIRPEYHVFGQVHEGYGVYFGKGSSEGITFINGSSSDMVYNALHPPIIFDVTIKAAPHKL